MDISRAALILGTGGIVCYPTETFYGLGIDPWNLAAREKLYALKQRPGEKELPLIAADFAMIGRFFDVTDERIQLLASRFWPGPLSIVLRTNPPNDRISPTCAVRVSSHEVARTLSATFGGPIVSTSANRSGEPSIRDVKALPADMISKIDVVLDAGLCAGGSPSTILSLLDGVPKILRAGQIPVEEINSVLK
jgi:L-threonylcarbamoyladenylate synthase